MNINHYKNKIFVKGLLTLDINSGMETIKDEEIQKYFLSLVFINCLKEIIMENNETNFISFKVKNKIFHYLSLIRSISLKQENKKEILDLINECIILCNQLNPSDDEIFYTNEFYIRTGGWKNIDQCYQYINNPLNKENVNMSILYDYYYLKQFLLEQNKDNDLVSEMALWSINKIVDDIPELLYNPIFYENCLKLKKGIKKNLKVILLEKGISTYNRIKKESKKLTRILR